MRYVSDGETRFVIMDGRSLMHARVCAAYLELGTFVEGHCIDRDTVARLLPHGVGRL